MQPIGKLKLQMFLTTLATPNIQSRQIHRPAKRILVVPAGVTYALHILQHALKKMVAQKVVKRTQIEIGDVIELKHLPSNFVVARNKRDDGMSELSSLR
jgi:hypothetical protein